MTDRPILFSAPMVRALLDGRKTQTRRVLKVAKGVTYADVEPYQTHHTGIGQWMNLPRDKVRDPIITAGDRLWVREAWRVSANHDKRRPVDVPVRACSVMFEAGGSVANHGDGAWLLDEEWPIIGVMPRWAGRLRASMHLPRWASRLTLIVQDVRVQRLQEISNADAIAEGIELRDRCFGTWDTEGHMICGGCATAAEAYRCLWININGPGSWDANPWVAVYSFDVIKANIDAIGGEK